ncbi:hypothetical protein TNCV_2865521 [Trichonephila clavipes]|nr:hypothetical protein TNCV_2865521 [Trichonephila clavipes]
MQVTVRFGMIPLQFLRITPWWCFLNSKERTVKCTLGTPGMRKIIRRYLGGGKDGSRGGVFVFVTRGRRFSDPLMGWRHANWNSTSPDQLSRVIFWGGSSA